MPEMCLIMNPIIRTRKLQFTIFKLMLNLFSLIAYVVSLFYKKYLPLINFLIWFIFNKKNFLDSLAE